MAPKEDPDFKRCEDAQPKPDGREVWLDLGDGLALLVRRKANGGVSKTFVWRPGPNNKIGSYPLMKIKEARDICGFWNSKRVLDPTFSPSAAKRAARKQRKEERQLRIASNSAAKHSLEWVAKEFFKVKETGTRRWAPHTLVLNKGWMKNHVPEHIQVMSITKHTTAHVSAILQKLEGRGPTADGVRKLLHQIFAFAMHSTRSWRSKELGNPAQWKGELDGDIKLAWMKDDNSRRHPSMKWEDIPRFWVILVADDTMAARALQFQILIALRPENATDTLVSEINTRKPGPLGTALWVIKAEAMKTKRRHGKAQPHDCYLNTTALDLLDRNRYEAVQLRGIDTRRQRPWRGTRMMLSNEQCDAIRAAPPEVTDTALAKQYGCSHTHIAWIRTGKRREPQPLMQTERPTPKPDDFLFPGLQNRLTGKRRSNSGGLGNDAPNECLKRIQRSLVQRGLDPFIATDDERWPVAHGFRSTFTTFARENTLFRSEVIRACTAHGDVVKDEDEDKRSRSDSHSLYFHGKLANDCAALMQVWGEFVTTGKVSAKWHRCLNPLSKLHPDNHSADVIDLDEHRKAS